MIDYSTRWDTELSFRTLLQLVIDNSQRDENLGITPDLYKTLPKTIDINIKREGIDLRGINLSNVKFGEVWMGHVLSDANISHSIFHRTDFHKASAFNTNFSASKFTCTQMCPFYAHAADFTGCNFDTCLAFGNSAIKEPYGYYNDFSECSFNHVSANDSSFHTCDFRKADLSNSRFINCDLSYSLFNGANLTQAYFEQCTFTDGDTEARDIRCDFRGCNLESVQFVACDFLHAKFDDTPLARAAVATGNNLNCDTIAWGK